LERFVIVPAATDELSFAQRVSRENMEKYYTAGGRSWDPAIFQASWPATENFSILSRDVLIGVLRLRCDPDAIYISDLQIESRSQRLGAGTFALRFVERVARERGVARIRLRVFPGNVAARLYQRAGFRKIVDEPEKQLYERVL
jgi:ribosomal protein S18 acetylase RimI-like enzyme